MKVFGLRNFLDQHNSWEKIFNKDHKTINIGNLTQKDVNNIADKLDSNMSPENLHCDGEISYAQAQAKADYYNAVWEELQDVCRQKGFKIPQVYEF